MAVERPSSIDEAVSDSPTFGHLDFGLDQIVPDYALVSMRLEAREYNQSHQTEKPSAFDKAVREKLAKLDPEFVVRQYGPHYQAGF